MLYIYVEDKSSPVLDVFELPLLYHLVQGLKKGIMYFQLFAVQIDKAREAGKYQELDWTYIQDKCTTQMSRLNTKVENK